MSNNNSNNNQTGANQPQPTEQQATQTQSPMDRFVNNPTHRVLFEDSDPFENSNQNK